jgi:hypothetical protein
VPRRLAAAEEPVVRIALAGNPCGIAHAWDLLVADRDADVRVELADPDWLFGGIPRDCPLPEPAQVRLAGSGPSRAAHDGASPRPGPTGRPPPGRRPVPRGSGRGGAALAPAARRRRPVVLTDPDPEIRRAALFTNVPPADLGTGLLGDPQTRAEAATRVRLDPGTANELATDPDRAVRVALAGIPSLPVPQVLRLAEEPDEDLRAEIMIRPQLPPGCAPG